MVDVVTIRIPPRIKEGISLVDQGKFKQAQDIFEGYLEVKPDSALAMSFAGILKSQFSGQPEEGLELCRKAMERDTEEALIYLNLAKAYNQVGNRYQCVQVLYKGLKIPSPHHARLEQYMKTIGVRRPLLIKGLNRNHPLNDIWGRLTWRLKRHK